MCVAFLFAGLYNSNIIERIFYLFKVRKPDFEVLDCNLVAERTQVINVTFITVKFLCKEESA